MGWFWSDSSAQPRYQSAPQSLRRSDESPPPGCPMHTPDHKASLFPPLQDNAPQTGSSCPVKSPNHPLRTPNASSSSVPDEEASRSTRSKYNPLNFMFSSLSNKPAESQSMVLGRERELSSIPRGDADSKWEYPSPQQMYNAMLRKGYTDTPIDAVTSMVEVHNFLNEGAWQEIVTWEGIFGKGLVEGWKQCRVGEENMAVDRARVAMSNQKHSEEDQPKLLRFEGRPKDMTPKATILQLMGRMYPRKFATDPPFDRHDWYVQRSTPTGPRQVRYVIDYYSGDPEPTGEPVFYLDIRPAIDTPTAAAERLMRWGGDVWYRASGASVREEARRQGVSK